VCICVCMCVCVSMCEYVCKRVEIELLNFAEIFDSY
jgi:hypothetical protein